MAKQFGKDVVYFKKAGLYDGQPGVIPGVVLSSRLEQQPDNSLAEVLTLLYAHPTEEKHAPHHASEIGSTQFSVKPFSKTNAFGWSDHETMPLEPEPEPITQDPQGVAPDDLSAPVSDPDTPAPEHVEPAA